MKLKALLLSLLIPLTVATHSAYAATTVAVQQMAEILLTMDKTPSGPQRDVLKQIAAGTNVSANEQNLAKAMLSINGAVTAEDKQLVWDVLRGISASEGERELAKIITRFDGKVSKSDQGRLAKLLPPKPKQEATAAPGKEEQKPDNNKK